MVFNCFKHNKYKIIIKIVNLYLYLIKWIYKQMINNQNKKYNILDK